jgi:hypothetical protein
MDASVPQGSRRSIRRCVTVGCEIVSERIDQLVAYRATEMSADGMWLQTAEPIRAGETVVVCFTPDDGDERELMVFAAVARVATARGATDETPGVGMGLELLDLDQGERTRLDRWLRERREPVPRRRRPLPRTPAVRPLPSCWR